MCRRMRYVSPRHSPSWQCSSPPVSRCCARFVPAAATGRRYRARDDQWSTGGRWDDAGAVVGLVAATVALLTAITLSSRFPVGFTRRAEADPGRRLDLPVFAAGVLVIVVICVACAAFAAWRSAASDSARPGTDAPQTGRRVSRLGRAIGNTRAPVTTVVGVGMTLDSRRGADAVPVRSAFATMTVVVAAVVGALVFATSLTHLVSTPALQGWHWDVLLAGDDAHRIAEQLAADDTSPAVADAVLVPVRLEGQKVATLAFRPIVGDGFSQIIEGQHPNGPRDIALGTKTMRSLGASIGDHVTAVYDDDSHRRTLVMRVVGRAVMPSALGYPGMALADGALTTDAALATLGVRDDQNDVMAFSVARSSTRNRHRSARHGAQTIGRHPQESTIGRGREPASGQRASVDRGRAARAIAAATIAHLLLTTVRRRRRDPRAAPHPRLPEATSGIGRLLASERGNRRLGRGRDPARRRGRPLGLERRRAIARRFSSCGDPGRHPVLRGRQRSSARDLIDRSSRTVRDPRQPRRLLRSE